MKKNLQLFHGQVLFVLFVLTFLAQSQLNAQTVFWSEDFETDGTGTRYAAPNQFIDDTLGSGGSEDYYGRIENTGSTLLYRGCANVQIDMTTPVSGQSGSFFMAGEDLDDIAGATSCGSSDQADTKTLDFLAINGHDINISGASTMTFRMLVAVGTDTNCNVANARWDAGEGLTVYYKKDGGAEVTALCFSPDVSCGTPSTTNEPLKTDPNCDGSGSDGTIVSNIFTEYTFTIPAGGNSLELRIEIDADAADEEIAFDNLRLEAVTTPLPVSMSALLLSQQENAVRLNWETKLELNSNYFSIERSQNGDDFIEVGVVGAAGYSAQILQYNFADQSALAGLNYYRVKLVDMDGTFSYSPISSIQVNKFDNEFTLVPNPASDIVSVVGLQKDVRYALFDCVGAKITEGKLSGQRQLNIEELPSGVYFVQLNINGKLVSKKLIKK